MRSALAAIVGRPHIDASGDSSLADDGRAECALPACRRSTAAFARTHNTRNIARTGRATPPQWVCSRDRHLLVHDSKCGHLWQERLHLHGWHFQLVHGYRSLLLVDKLDQGGNASLELLQSSMYPLPVPLARSPQDKL